MTTGRSRLRAALRVAKWGALALAVLVVAAAVAAPAVLRGPRLGRAVEAFLPPMRGQITVGGGSWSWSGVLALLRGRAAPFELEQVRVTDPDGVEVLRARRLTAQVQLGRGGAPLVVRDLHVEDGAWRFARAARPGEGVGFLAAFASRARRARGTAPARRAAGLRIEGARLDDVQVVIDLADWGLALHGAHATAALGVEPDASGRQVFTFEVRDADITRGGSLRLGGARAPWVLPFGRARLDRVATPARAPDAIELRASGVETGRSRLTIDGAFTGVYGVSRPPVPPGIALTARLDEAADAVAALAAGHLPAGITAGAVPGAFLRLAFSGPFTRLALEGEARGFETRLPGGRVGVRGAGLRFSADVGARKLAVRDVTLESLGGGRLTGEASADGPRVEARVAAQRFDVGAVLPPSLAAASMPGTLDGSLEARADLASASGWVGKLDLALRRPAGAPGPRVVHLRAAGAPRGGGGGARAGELPPPGTLRLPPVTVALLGTRVAIGGDLALWDPGRRAWRAPPVIDVTVRTAAGARLRLDALVEGGFVSGAVAARARVRGTPGELTATVELPGRQQVSVLGEAFGLPERFTARLDRDGLQVAGVRLTGPRDSQLRVGGRVGLAPLDLALEAGARDFPIERIPGLGQTKLPFTGWLSGALRVSGPPARPSLAGKLMVRDVAFQGRPVAAATGAGAGELTVEPVAGGGLRARGRLVDGVDADGTLAFRPGGLEGDASLELRHVRLEPYLAVLLDGLPAAGVASGRVVARIAPGAPARVEGRLTELALAVTPPPPLVVGPVQIAADGDIPFAAVSNDGPLSVGPARFKGGFLGGAVGLAGGLSKPAGGKPRVDLDVSGEADARLAAVLAPAFVRRASGKLRVTGHIAGPPARPRVTGAAELGRLTFDLPALAPLFAPAAPETVEIASGRVEMDDLALALRAVRVNLGSKASLTLGPAGGEPGRVRLPAPEGGGAAAGPWGGVAFDVPITGQAGGLAMSGVRLDGARFAVALRGDGRAPPTLSGDVQVTAAQVDAVAAQAAASGGAKGGGARGAGKRGGAARLGGGALGQTRLDLRVRSAGGALAVDVPKIPDIAVDVDFRVRGTLGRPEPSGQARGAGAYSRFVLWLGKLLQ